jgi:hypothetical protein
VQAGARLELAFAQLGGNLEARQGSRLRADGARIGGNLKCEACVLERLVFTPVGGNAKLEKSPDGGFVFGSTINGGLEIVESTGRTFVFFVSGASIGGDLKFEKGAGFGLIATSNTIRGNVQVLKSSDHRLIQNQVSGNVQVVENRGTFPSEISRNTIGGDLQCEKNEPPPAGGFNVAAKKQGQCAEL